MSALLVAIGGFFGAISRFALNNFIKRKYTSSFPYGTFLINVLGSFLLGCLIGANVEESVLLLCGTGFMGAFTTFSTFKLELTQLVAKREGKVLVIYAAASYIVGILAAFVGFAIAA